MGSLALAGAISGAGQGLEKGLNNLQTTVGASYLQDEKIKADNLRQQRLMEFEQGQLETKLTTEERIHRDDRAANERLENRKMAHGDFKSVLEQSSREEIERDKLDAENRKTVMREWGETDRHNKDMEWRKEESAARKAFYEKALGKAGTGKEGSQQSKELHEYIASIDKRITGLYEAKGKLLPGDKAGNAALDAKINKYEEEVEGIYGILRGKLGVPGKPAPTPEPGIIKDMYSDNPSPANMRSKAATPATAAPAPAAAPVTAAPPQRTNVVRDGQAQLKALETAITAAESDPNMNPDTIKQMRAEYARLLERWGRPPASGLLDAAATQP